MEFYQEIPHGFEYYFESTPPQPFWGMGEVLAVLLGTAAVLILLAVLAAAAVTYVLQAWGLYTMAQRRGLAHPWLAWVPIGSSWLLGALADRIGACRGKKTSYAVLLLALTAGLSASGLLVLLNPLLALLVTPAGLVLSVLTYMALYEIYRDCEPRNAVLFLVLSVLLSAQWLLLFILRGKLPPEETPCDLADPPPPAGWQPAPAPDPLPPAPAPDAEPAAPCGWQPVSPRQQETPSVPEHWEGMVRLEPPQQENDPGQPPRE